MSAAQLATSAGALDVLALDEALTRLAARNAEAAELVKLRLFVDMTMHEAATVLGVPQRTAERIWTYPRSFLAERRRRHSHGGPWERVMRGRAIWWCATRPPAAKSSPIAGSRAASPPRP